MLDTYYVEQQATVWVRVRVEADSWDDAVDKAETAIGDGDGEVLLEGLDLTSDFWAENFSNNVSGSLKLDDAGKWVLA